MRRIAIVLLAAWGADQVMAVATTPMMAGVSPIAVVLNLGIFAVVPLGLAWWLTNRMPSEQRVFVWTVGIVAVAAFLLHQYAFDRGLL